MGVMAALNETLYFGKEKLNDLVNPAAEGFLIQMVVTLIMIPLIIIVIIPIVLIGSLMGSPGGPMIGLFIALAYVIVMLVLTGASTMAVAIIIGGQVEAIDRTRKNITPQFGDVFRYGWRNKWQLMGTFYFNFLLYFGLTLLPIFYLVFIISLIDTFPVWFILFSILGVFLFFMGLAPFNLGIVVLPFVIRKRTGTRPVRSVLNAWKFYIANFKDFYLMGLFYTIFIFIASMLPGVSILVQLALYPTIITTELILYDDITGNQFYRPRYVRYPTGYQQTNPYDR
ncbi:MAG: hypothetical protein ACMUIE_08900 [Thermoplasmatota archaeon]